MGSGEGSGVLWKDAYNAIGVTAAVAGSVAYAVHHYEQDKAATEIKRVEDKAAMHVARVEGERKLAEQQWKAEVARYKHDVVLQYSQDYKPYQEEFRKRRSGGTWWSWLLG